jgi:hypothetical protein
MQTGFPDRGARPGLCGPGLHRRFKGLHRGFRLQRERQSVETAVVDSGFSPERQSVETAVVGSGFSRNVQLQRRETAEPLTRDDSAPPDNRSPPPASVSHVGERRLAGQPAR